MDTCQFNYINRRTRLETTARGVERSWDDLKVECHREGPGIPGATYYKRLGTAGPELFAVMNENEVFYHDEGEWYQYATATNILFGRQGGEPHAPTRDLKNANDEERYGIEDS
jgi:hypothetical protein